MKYIKTFEKSKSKLPKLLDYAICSHQSLVDDYSYIYQIKDIEQDFHDKYEKLYFCYDIENENFYTVKHAIDIIFFSENLEDVEAVVKANKYNL